MTLRTGTTEDLQQLAAWETDPDTSIWLGEIGPAWHTRALDDPDQDHLVAVEAGTPIGFAVLAGLSSADRSIELRRMVVRPARRHAGRGRALLRAALTRAYQRHTARRVWLDVKAHNDRARALYESEGFTVTDTVKGAVIEADGTVGDLLIMVHQTLEGAELAGRRDGA
ncbi:GNAT family N-acetyltransferase [Nonomuraea sp. SYSU D8015]|uniref:GNAT family N-acetyltransferase n=1 Tax=Nonomuraea sp. SYSU D8015 TaxID=2593644 RepID=UPI0016606F81|nr:GNAT family N-acetyltransferase [Nonomuraea sp. SYSU D8015]